MYITRPYQPGDLDHCTQCLYEGFFRCNITPNDRQFLRDYTQVMIEKSNFTYVAETEGQVVGFICGTYQKEFDPSLAKKFDNPRHPGLFIKFTLKYFLKLYHFSRDFHREFRMFFSQVQQRESLPVGKCDCELAALSSRRDYRRGLGTALLGAMVERCSSENAKTIRLFTDTDATYTFYEKRGFQLVGERPYEIGGKQGRSLVYELVLGE